MPANKILFLANYFPPRPAVAGRRLGHLATWARKHYEKVFVIRADRNFSGEDLPDLQVIALPARDLRSLLGGSGPAQTLPHGSFRKQAYGPLLTFRQSFPFLYLTDDGGPLYRRAAYREAVRLIEGEGITTLVSSFRPWSDHLIARRLKKRFPHLYWIADFRDLHADPVRRDVWWPALQRWWARRVIRRADEVWGVSEGQVQYLRELHPAATVRRNRLFALPPATTDPRTDRFTIVYTGSLYVELQTVRPLITALNELIAEGAIDPDDVELIYRGKDDGLWTEWTTDLHPHVHCNTRSYIAPASAQKLQEEAQMLLLLNWSAPNYYGVLTAKLYDYLGTGRPVMALVNGPGDPELRRIIEGSRAGRVFATGHSPADWLLGCYQQWRDGGGRVPWSADLARMAEYLENQPVGSPLRASPE
ncbi:hypothetical protein GGR26_002435 [Lewinella marina]|uniref:Glycosyltransferase subfamily 4-like N-terminal domain-containing protein n=1 Tax=Neolewinella marina TaxID=438751 RepID=A0A2G0CBX7_9BACT|nr:hypothetical protein [Neolewinella marina]NJB86658.1 hypothetical protein [Neolewinella marina]PHK97466.1 hypothetical protein CGL56_15315 [Neolewinella marina]